MLCSSVTAIWLRGDESFLLSVTGDPIKLNKNPIKLDGILMEIQAPMSTQYRRVC